MTISIRQTMANRTLYLHAGLHKTGTTALQVSLSVNSEKLAAHSYRFPVMGRPWRAGGQHNIAWEITGDRRFQASYGTFSDVLEEARDDSSDVILSSEDFTGALVQADAFRDFVAAARKVFSGVCVIVYLRNQVDYAVSLYLELLVHGLDLPFDAFLKEITARGELRWREWTFPLDFREFLSKISAIDGTRLVVHSYELNKDALVQDFLETCGFPGAVARTFDSAHQNSRRAAGVSLTHFIRNRLLKSPSPFEEKLLGEIEQRWGQESVSASPDERRLLLDAFRVSNGRVTSQTGVPLNDLMNPAGGAGSIPVDTLTMSRVFSFEFQKLFVDLASELETETLRTSSPVQTLEADLQKLQAECDLRQAQLERRELEFQAAEARSAELRAHLEASQAELKKLQTALDEANSNLEQLAAERHPLSQARGSRLVSLLRRPRH